MFTGECSCTVLVPVKTKTFKEAAAQVMVTHKDTLTRLAASEAAEKGTKYDGGKAPLHHIRMDALEQVARVFEFGERKYPLVNGTPNYMLGMQWLRLSSAAMRHIMAWVAGETNDPESGENHLSHAACCLLMLLTYSTHNLGTDNRHKHPKL